LIVHATTPPTALSIELVVEPPSKQSVKQKPEPNRPLLPPPHSDLLDALEHTRANLELAIAERKHSDLQGAEEVHQLRRQVKATQRANTALQLEVAADKDKKQQHTQQHLSPITPIKLQRNDKVQSWEDPTTRRTLQELCRRHAKESDAQAAQIATVTSKLQAFTGQPKTSEVARLKRELSGLVSQALQTRRQHDRELQQVSRQLLQRPDAVPMLKNSHKKWGQLMSRIDFMPKGLRELVKVRVGPALAANDYEAAAAKIDAVEHEYLVQIWKETKETGEESVGEALDLVQSIASMNSTKKAPPPAVVANHPTGEDEVQIGASSALL
jgi:hypothetical protein